MTLTHYGRLLRRTRPLRIAAGLLVTSPVWVPLLAAGFLAGPFCSESCQLEWLA